MSALRDEARTILAAATPGTDRTLLVWAVGAYRIRHCLYLARYRAERRAAALAAEHAGGTTGAFRWVDIRGRVTISHRRGGGDYTVPWREVAVLLDRVIDRPALVAEQDALLTERRAAVAADDELARRWQHAHLPRPTAAEIEANDEAWREIEHRCEAAAERTWQACRPAGVQLDLLAGLAEPGATEGTQ